jgi:hypothetical protein
MLAQPDHFRGCCPHLQGPRTRYVSIRPSICVTHTHSGRTSQFVLSSGSVCSLPGAEVEGTEETIGGQYAKI